ncbi:hypothetical protein ACFL6U_32815, partial [Planctomycetota bacterium]
PSERLEKGEIQPLFNTIPFWRGLNSFKCIVNKEITRSERLYFCRSSPAEILGGDKSTFEEYEALVGPMQTE